MLLCGIPYTQLSWVGVVDRGHFRTYWLDEMALEAGRQMLTAASGSTVQFVHPYRNTYTPVVLEDKQARRMEVKVIIT